MKSSQEKKRLVKRPATSSAEHSFYDQGGYQPPLSGTASGQRNPKSRTSRHMEVRRRENPNRATNKALLFLVIKIALTPVLLLAGYFVLKFATKPFSEPSDKEREEWAETSARMDGESAPVVLLDGAVVDSAFLVARLKSWEKTGQVFRSAEALSLNAVDLNTAIESLKKSLNTAPNDRRTLQLLLDIYVRAGVYAEAIPVCIRLLDQENQRGDLKLVLLDLLVKTEAFDPAFLLAKELLLEQPNTVEALEVVASMNDSAGNSQGALDAYLRIVENQKDHLTALLGAADIYMERGEWEQAITYYLKWMELSSGPDPEIYRAITGCYAHVGKSADAVMLLGQAVEFYDEAEVATWLDAKDFDSIRETTEFRALVDKKSQAPGAPRKRSEVQGKDVPVPDVGAARISPAPKQPATK